VTQDELRVVLDEYFGISYVWAGFCSGFLTVIFPAFWGWVRSIWKEVDE